MNTNASTDDKLLKQLAVAVVDHPRSTLKELAEAVGISKATLHRFCGTRENLEVLLMQKSIESMQDIIKMAAMEYDDYVSGIRSLIHAFYTSKEFLRYGNTYQNCVTIEHCNDYARAVDSFFLRGQKQGVFRIDISVPALTDLFFSVIYGGIDSERRGRVASSYILETIEDFFLHGAKTEE